MVFKTATGRKFNIINKNKHLTLFKSFVTRRKNRVFMFSKTFLMRLIAMLEEVLMPNPPKYNSQIINLNYQSRYVF
jgi:hypothetical protein